MDLSALRNAYQSGGIEECIRHLEKKRDEWKDIPLNVAVIGNSGAGKSSFINAIRRLTADDEGAAEVGVTQTTVDIRSYSHPSNPLLKFWDLPGVGTDRFPRQTYLSDIDVDLYDFFLLITSTRFMENDTWLGKEFRSRNKKYFFIRTKVGRDVSDNKRSHPRTHRGEDVVKAIRESTENSLKQNGCDDVPVYLIDSYELQKFEFLQLEDRLIEDFPELKKSAFLLSMHAAMEKKIRSKVAELRSRIWMSAALSGNVAAPLSGVSFSYDTALVVAQATFFHEQLGLDESSLKRYAMSTSTDFEQLKSVASCVSFTDEESGKIVVSSILRDAAPITTSVANAISEVLEEAARFIPLIGSFIPAPLSFGGTYLALKTVLDKMESVALDVVKCAAQNCIDNST